MSILRLSSETILDEAVSLKIRVHHIGVEKKRLEERLCTLLSAMDAQQRRAYDKRVKEWGNEG